MIDYIEISNSLYKDSPNLTFCKGCSNPMNDFGWETFKVDGCKEMVLYWNPQSRLIRLKGSLPYFLKGHNFSFSRREYVESIELLQDILQVGLWDARFDLLEYGVIFPVEKSPSQYIKNHTAGKRSKLNENWKGNNRGKGKWWDNADEILKMYDAGANIKKKQRRSNRGIIEEDGYNPNLNYLKFEAHFIKPFKLNFGKDMLVEDMQNPQSLMKMKQILLSQYHLLSPMKELLKPTDKKEFKVIDIVVREFVKELMNDGKSIEQAKEQIKQSIREADFLDKEDRDSRNGTINKAFNKLQEAEHSEWDLTSKIEDALDKE